MELMAEDSAEFVASAAASEPEAACEALEGPVLLSFLKRALAVFLQANCTGPQLVLPTADRSILALDGEDVTSNIEGAQYIAAASSAVRQRFEAFETCPYAHLWAARVLSVHQRCLLSPVPTLKTAVLEHYDQAVAEVERDGDRAALAEVHIEVAMAYLRYGKHRKAQELLAAAQDLTGLQFWLTGKMGYRTKYQQTPTAQLVCEAVSVSSHSGMEVQTPESVGLDFDPDNILLETPKLTEELKRPETVLDQCILLGVVQHQVKSKAEDELQKEVIGAYLESTLQQSLNWLVFSTALLYRSRNQFQSYKTRERSGLQLQALIKQFKDPEPAPSLRLRYYFTCDYPLRYWQHFELGEMWMKLGAVASALEMFETVEMHEEAIECLMITEQLNRAREMALERLRVAETPRLLCTLGDITGEESYYLRAWEVSSGHCSRAQRTLARRAFEQQRFLACADHYTLALQVNPLFHTAWFTQGCALMRLERWPEASHAFVQVVSLEEGQSDAWNNLAACRIQEGKPQEAFLALEQGLKHSRRNWKMWENMLNLAIQLRKTPAMLEAFDSLLELHHFTSFPDSVFRIMWVIGAKEGKFERVRKLFIKFSQATSPSPFFWKVYADLLCAAQSPLDQFEVIQLRLKACRALMKTGWEEDAEACEQLLVYTTEVATAYGMLGSDQVKLEGRIFVQQVKQQVEKTLRRDISFPPF